MSEFYATYLYEIDGVEYRFEEVLPDPDFTHESCVEHPTGTFEFEEMIEDEIKIKGNWIKGWFRQYICDECGLDCFNSLEDEDEADDGEWDTSLESSRLIDRDRVFHRYKTSTEDFFYLIPTQDQINRHQGKLLHEAGQLTLF